jgi:hypothetical protein
VAEKGYKVFSAHGARDLADPDDRFILRKGNLDHGFHRPGVR